MDDPSSSPKRIRIGNRERSEALDQLSTAFTEGYLDVYEFDSRTASAASAEYQDEISVLFHDLPDLSDGAQPTAATMPPHSLAQVPVSSAAVDLDDVMARGKKVAVADAAIWTVTMAVFFLGLFVFQWNYFWLAFIAGGLGSAAARAVIGLSDEEEEVYEELEEAERKQRAERLEIAKRRRLELDSGK